ncbi:hypothetical protein C8A01DRAFT_50544 [Parachaetomium inaequale]|uniref:Uncharacterized protein n=1 Tax=Parachaetomium inaequale TaxID=2588326 RepID=A0AAN6P8G6_9PEZI|nr:hypothetical protein C8A01DRAFT_50544 [Parachaetomium inaequale]
MGPRLPVQLAQCDRSRAFDMASAGSLVLPRDAEAGSNNLTTGAIAGIACGAGALFLGAAGLFVVYWRRQRQYDREDNSDSESYGERRLPGAMAPAVTYTMDYKMDDPQHNEGDHASSYTYSPEKAAYSFSQLSAPDTASAMPTHPAYIPRALVRGSTPSNRSVATASPPPFPSPPFPSTSSHPKTQPDDTMILAYLAAAAQRQTASSSQIQPQDHHPTSESDSSYPSGLPMQPAPQRPRQHSSPTQIPTLSIPSLTSPPHSASSTDASQHPLHPHTSQTSQGVPRKPRAYLPPRLTLSSDGPAPAPKKRSRTGGDKPLSGKETTTISGPLAFPHLIHPPPVPQQSSRSGWAREDDTTADDLWGGEGEYYETAAAAATQSSQPDNNGGRRTFLTRALEMAGGSGSGAGDGEGVAKDSKGKGKSKHGRKRSDRNSGGHGGNRHYAEIEIGRGSDIW